MELRPYQQAALEANINAIESGESPLVIMATGTGKTVIMAKTIEHLSREKKGLVVAHRGLLLNQIEAELAKWTGIQADREQSTRYAQWDSEVITTTPATLKDIRLHKKPTNRGFIIVDECHRAVTPSMMEIYKHFAEPLKVGFTATADRPDGVSLYPTFTKIAYQYSLARGIKDGFLSRIIGRKIHGMELDLSGLRAVGQDFSDDDVAAVIEEDLVSIAHNVIRETEDRSKVLIFMPNVASSEHIARVLQELGETADYVSGGNKENGRVMAEFRSGQLKYMAACQLVIEGYDEPGIDCIVMLRPTLSRIVYSQAIGRGTRIANGKDHCRLVEFTYNSNKHKLVSPFELLGDNMSQRVVERAEAVVSTPGDIDYLQELEGVTARQYDVKAIVARAVRRDFNFTSFNPLDVGDLLGQDLDKESDIWFEGRRLTGAITEKQREILSRYMIDTEGLNKATASKIISTLRERSMIPMLGYASDKQMAFLRRLYPESKFESLTKAAAGMLIASALEAQNGRVAHDL
jgi:superfamily II DNA or RNA helicase